MIAAVDVLCAGAAKGLVLAVAQRFAAANDGARIDATFGAVGALRDALRQGAPCDVLVLTGAMLEALEASGEVVPGTFEPLGRVATGVAVVDGAPRPDIADAAALKRALLDASAIHFPDAVRSTAGAHVADVLRRLGLHDPLSARFRMRANGAIAMRDLAESGDPKAIGCTQVTEIRYTPGIALVGALPPGFGLVTLYGVAVPRGARQPQLAQRLVALLAGDESRGLRRDGGFEVDLEPQPPGRPAA